VSEGPSRPVRSLTLAVLATLLLAGCSNVRIDESDVFLPKPSVTPASFNMDGVSLNELYFTVDDSLQLNAWHLTQPDAEATVLFFGGNGFYLVQSLGYIRALTGFPVNVFMYDYRGYGRSDGEPSVPAFKRDAEAAYRLVTDSLGASPDRLVVHGHSLGTFLATHVASQQPAAGLVLENPATDVDGWVDSVVPWFVRLFVDLEVDDTLQGESNVAALRESDVPLLIVGGENDNVTSPDMARTLHDEAANTPKDLVIVEEGSHNELYTASAYQAAYAALLDTVRTRADSSKVAQGESRAASTDDPRP
jgi:hypothetical protein